MNAFTAAPFEDVHHPAISIINTGAVISSDNLGSDKVDPIKMSFATEICQNAVRAALLELFSVKPDGTSDVIDLSDPALQDQNYLIAQEHMCNSFSRAIAFALEGEPYETYVASAKARPDELLVREGLDVFKFVLPKDLYDQLLAIK